MNEWIFVYNFRSTVSLSRTGADRLSPKEEPEILPPRISSRFVLLSNINLNAACSQWVRNSVHLSRYVKLAVTAKSNLTTAMMTCSDGLLVLQVLPSVAAVILCRAWKPCMEVSVLPQCYTQPDYPHGIDVTLFVSLDTARCKYNIAMAQKSVTRTTWRTILSRNIATMASQSI